MSDEIFVVVYCIGNDEEIKGYTKTAEDADRVCEELYMEDWNNLCEWEKSITNYEEWKRENIESGICYDYYPEVKRLKPRNKQTI